MAIVKRKFKCMICGEIYNVEFEQEDLKSHVDPQRNQNVPSQLEQTFPAKTIRLITERICRKHPMD